LNQLLIGPPCLCRALVSARDRYLAFMTRRHCFRSVAALRLGNACSSSCSCSVRHWLLSQFSVFEYFTDVSLYLLDHWVRSWSASACKQLFDRASDAFKRVAYSGRRALYSEVGSNYLEVFSQFDLYALSLVCRWRCASCRRARRVPTAPASTTSALQAFRLRRALHCPCRCL